MSLLNTHYDTNKEQCFYKMLKCDSKLVKFLFEQNGLVGTDRHDWNLLWTNTHGHGAAANSGKIALTTSYFYERLVPHNQKVNHFPGSNELTRKDKMAVNI